MKIIIQGMKGVVRTTLAQEIYTSLAYLKVNMGIDGELFDEFYDGDNYEEDCLDKIRNLDVELEVK